MPSIVDSAFRYLGYGLDETQTISITTGINRRPCLHGHFVPDRGKYNATPQPFDPWRSWSCARSFATNYHTCTFDASRQSSSSATGYRPGHLRTGPLSQSSFTLPNMWVAAPERRFVSRKKTNVVCGRSTNDRRTALSCNLVKRKTGSFGGKVPTLWKKPALPDYFSFRPLQSSVRR